MRSALDTELPTGTQPADRALEIRKAGMRDIQAILELINAYAAKGVMLPRTEFEMSENIRDFSVVYEEKRLVACGALHFYTPTSAEIRSLAVDPELKGRGLGRVIISCLETEAIADNLHAIFAFTYVAEFFRKLGFHEVERGELPLKAWKDCLRCPKFQCCDETPMVKDLVENPILAPAPERFSPLVQFPRLKII